MKQLILLFACVFFYGNESISQDFIPTIYEKYIPIWSHYSSVDTLPINIQGYTPEDKPLIKDGNLYLLHNIFEKGFQGHLLEKIHLKNGELNWKQHKFFNEINTREYASNLHIEDDRVRIIINKETQTPKIFGFGFWFGSIMGSRGYDLFSGSELDSTLADSTNIRTTAFGIPGGLGGGYSDVFYNDGQTKYVQQGSNTISSVSIDDTGHAVDTALVYTLDLSYSSQLTQFEHISNNEILSMNFARKNGLSPDSQQINIYKYDLDLNNVFNKNITSLLPLDYEKYQLKSLSNGYFNILSRQYLGPQPQTLVVSSFDLVGEFKEVAYLPKALYNSVATTTIAEDSTMLICMTREENGKSNIYFYKSDGFGELTLLKNIIPKSEDDLISVRKMYFTPDDQLLIYFAHISKKILAVQPQPPKWTNWVLFSTESLGLPTSTSKVLPPKLSFTCAPNPTTDLVDLDFGTKFTGQVEIIDNSGRLIESFDVHKRQHYKLSVGHLSSGMYYIHAYSSNIIDGAYNAVKLVKE